MAKKTKKQPSAFKQKTANKIFLIRLSNALKKASNTELYEVSICVQKEILKRKQQVKKL